MANKPINMATGGLMSLPPYIKALDESDKEIRKSDDSLKRQPAGVGAYDVSTPESARKGLPSRLLAPGRTRFKKGEEVKKVIQAQVPGECLVNFKEMNLKLFLPKSLRRNLKIKKHNGLRIKYQNLLMPMTI